jgi:hypothetical protein
LRNNPSSANVRNAVENEHNANASPVTKAPPKPK